MASVGFLRYRAEQPPFLGRIQEVNQRLIMLCDLSQLFISNEPEAGQPCEYLFNAG